MNMRNINGPSTVSCGTPDFTSTWSDDDPLSTTGRDRWVIENLNIHGTFQALSVT